MFLATGFSNSESVCKSMNKDFQDRGEAARLSLSVAIIAKDEEISLAKTLLSVTWADEIILIDSGSSDDTVALSRSHGARVFFEEWQGFANQKNSAIAKCTKDWILSLDADEMVSDELRDQIQQLLSAPPNCDAFYVNRRNYFLGRWMKHGGFYPDRKLRLFKRGAARFEQRSVHETIEYHGATMELDGDLIHDAYPSLDMYLEHMNRYSSLAAGQVKKRGSKPRLVSDVLLRPLATFAYNFILRAGFLDGREGFLLNLYHAVYVSWKYAKAWNLINRPLLEASTSEKPRELDSGMFPGE